MKIEMMTYINGSASDYAEYLKYNCDKLASGNHEIKWKCIESGKADRLPDGFECVAHVDQSSISNSMNHALAVNLSQKYFDSDLCIIIDADVAITYKNWDKIIINELEKFHCFGAGYENSLKYQNFPTVYLFAFRKEILKKVTLDFRPELVDGSEKPLRKKLNIHDAPVFGLKQGSVIKCDTGWKLPLIIKGAGFISNTMPMILMKDKTRLLPFIDKKHKQFCLRKPTHQAEWHYVGKLFATHKQACRVHPLNGEYGQSWKKRIDLYLKNTYPELF